MCKQTKDDPKAPKPEHPPITGTFDIKLPPDGFNKPQPKEQGK